MSEIFFDRRDSAAKTEVSVSREGVGEPAGALLVLPLTGGELPLRVLEEIERTSGLELARRAAALRPETREGAVRLVPGTPRIALAGLGDEVDHDAVRAAAAAAARSLEPDETSLVWCFDEQLLDPEGQVRAVVEGVLLGLHDPARWRSVPPRRRLERLTIAGAPDGLGAFAERIATIARWTNVARILVDAPPNKLTPAVLADEARALLEGLPVAVEVLDAEEIEAAGLHALAAVGQGSANEPRLIVLRYGDGADPGGRIGLVGKGVTFDSGGLFLKPQGDLVRQKADMGGAAAVLAAVGAIAELQIGLDVLAVIPAAENMLGGSAYRPGDVIATAAGLSVEVTNPDAEGRLLLADGIWYANRQGVGSIVDLATLTGAMRGGMGDLYAGVFASPETLRDRIVEAGSSTGDHAWPWPLHRRYDEPIVSKLADLRNTAGRTFGYPIFAAAFLRRFAEGTPWAHVDLHSTAFLDEQRGYLGAGATGAGVRMLVELVRGLAST